jgi:hypothetical protein
VRKALGALVPATFSAFLAVVGLCAAFSPGGGFSDIENRELAPFPAIVENGEINGEFIGDFTDYYNDAFPMRDAILRINRKIDAALTLNPFPGGDDIAFIETVPQTQADPAPESAPAPEQTPAQDDAPTPAATPAATPSATPGPTPTPEPTPVRDADPSSGIVIVGDRAFELFNYDETRARRYAEAVESMAVKCGVPTYVVMPPSPSELYLPDKYKNEENSQNRMFEYLEGALNTACFVDLRDEFEAARGNYIYFRTDHHWTADGAYIAYAKFMKTAGNASTLRSLLDSGTAEGFLGSLYKSIAQNAKSDDIGKSPDSVKYYFTRSAPEVMNYTNAGMTDGQAREVLITDYKETTNLYNIFWGGDTQLLHIHNGGEDTNGKSVAVVRDSYGHAFLPFLANDYADIYAIEPRSFASFPLSDFIAEHEIDELLFLNYSISATSKYWQNWAAELEKLS